MNVAVVLEQADTQAGMERQALRLARGLARRGARVTVVTTYWPPGFGIPAPATPPQLESRDGYEIVRVPCYRWWSGEAVRAYFALSLGRVVASRKIEVVYTVQYQGALHALRARTGGEFPIVVKFACGGSYGDLSQVAQRPDGREVLDALAKVDRYACLSQEVLAEVEKAGLPAGRSLLVRNGVDTSVFSPEGAKAPDLPPKTVLFVGRLDGQKRVTNLLRAFAQLPDKETHLALAGKGPQEAEVRGLVAELHLGDRVHLLGERKDVPELLRAASVFVLPSAAEGMPNALIEALSTGVPSVATDIPGTHDVARHEKEALLVPLDDVAALSTALQRLLEDRELAQRLSKAARERIAQEFDMERVTDAHLALFEQLKKPHQPPRLGRLRWQLMKALIVGWFYALGRRLRPR